MNTKLMNFLASRANDDIDQFVINSNDFCELNSHVPLICDDIGYEYCGVSIDHANYIPVNSIIVHYKGILMPRMFDIDTANSE